MNGDYIFRMIKKVAGSSAANLLANALVIAFTGTERFAPLAKPAERWLLGLSGPRDCQHCHKAVVGASRADFHDLCWKKYVQQLSEELHDLDPTKRSLLLAQLGLPPRGEQAL